MLAQFFNFLDVTNNSIAAVGNSISTSWRNIGNTFQRSVANVWNASYNVVGSVTGHDPAMRGGNPLQRNRYSYPAILKPIIAAVNNEYVITGILLVSSYGAAAYRSNAARAIQMVAGDWLYQLYNPHFRMGEYYSRDPWHGHAQQQPYGQQPGPYYPNYNPAYQYAGQPYQNLNPNQPVNNDNPAYFGGDNMGGDNQQQPFMPQFQQNTPYNQPPMMPQYGMPMHPYYYPQYGGFYPQYGGFQAPMQQPFMPPQQVEPVQAQPNNPVGNPRNPIINQQNQNQAAEQQPEVPASGATTGARPGGA